jgi:hypothetical protein
MRRSTQRSLASALGGLFLIVGLPAGATAQVVGGSISGTVTDPSSAPISGADVAILNTDTGVLRQLTTNARGFFNAPNLLPGPYQVAVSYSGFAATVKKLGLKVGQAAVANVQLALGGVAEMVGVQATSGALDLGSSTVGATVGGTTIRQLPLNGRDWTMLATLEPGTHTIDTQNPVSLGNVGRVNRGWGTQITVSGARPQQNNYRLDGISINDWSGGGPGNTLGMNLGVEAIQEYSLVSSNASAEYGKASGGVFNAVTRAGTNDFHGSVYEFYRNDAFDARNFFDGPEPPPFSRHQFGVSAAGPIRRDRTFFFVDYEGLREDLSTTNLITVPSTAARRGQLASGNVTVNPSVLPYLALFPLPNVSERGDSGVASLVQQSVTREDFGTARLDHTFAATDFVHGTFMWDNGRTTRPDTHDLLRLADLSRRHVASAEHTHVFGPRLVNAARLGYSRVTGESPLPVETLNPLADDPALAFIPGRLVGTIMVTGLTRFPGVSNQSRFYQTSLQAYDDLFYTWASHALKFGVSVEHLRLQESTLSSQNGVFNFGSVRNFLTNVPTDFSAAVRGSESEPFFLRQTVLGAYFQDDWRLRPNLTLNLGLRYEMATVPTEKNDRLATLAALTDTRLKLGAPYFSNPTLLDFAPRLGFSWDPFKDGRTTIRGGYGIYDNLPLLHFFTTLTMLTAPYARLGDVSSPGAGSFPNRAYSLINPQTDAVSYVEQDPKRSYVHQFSLSSQRQVFQDLIVQLGYVGTRGVNQPFRTQDTDIVLPEERPEGLFWPIPRGSGRRLNENFGSIQSLAWSASTAYDALMVKVQKVMRHGVQGGVSYTWSKGTDNNSATNTGGQFQNSLSGLPLFFLDRWEGPSDYDVRHSLVAHALVEIPGPRSAKGLLGVLANGWQLGGIFRTQSGHPFTPVIGGDTLGQRSGNPFNFPDRVDSAECANPVNPGNPSGYLKTECFVVPQPSNRMGNSGRNSVYGPGLENLDLTLYKNTLIPSISDAFNVQFRLEVFNVLDHANFRPPTGATAQVFNVNLQRVATAGQLTATSTTSRQIQLAVKLVW